MPVLRIRQEVQAPALVGSLRLRHRCPGAFADGRQFRILAIVDDFTRECLTLVPDTSLPGLRVVRELDALLPLAVDP